MKKQLLSLLVCILLVAFARADSDYQVTYVEVAEPTIPFPFSFDISVGAGLNFSDSQRYATDMLVVEGEFARIITPHHAFTLSGVFGTGRENHDGIRWDGVQMRPFTNNYSRWTASLMGGYRFTQKLGRLVVQVGAKAGPDLQHLKVDYGRNYRARQDHQYDGMNPLTGKKMGRSRDDCDLAFGLAYAAYAQVGIKMTENMQIYMNYTYWGSTAAPYAYLSGGVHPLKLRSDTLGLHEIRLGVSFTY